jgi:hypothetical protein
MRDQTDIPLITFGDQIVNHLQPSHQIARLEEQPRQRKGRIRFLFPSRFSLIDTVETSDK